MSEGSVSLDTSVLLRLLVAQPIDQFRAAMRFLKEQQSAGVVVHVGDLVLAEGYFALQSFYKIPKADSLLALARFIEHSGVVVSDAAKESLAVTGIATAKPGFVDRLIIGAARSAGHTLVTFEKSAHKLPSTRVLQVLD